MKNPTASTSAGYPRAQSEKQPEERNDQDKVPRRVRRNRPAILAGLLAGLVVLGVGLAAIAQQPTRYAVTSTVSFAPRAPGVQADIVQLAATKYAVVAGASTTLDSAARRNSMTTARLRDAVSVSVQQTTANVDIKVTVVDSAQAAEAANAIASVVAGATDSDKLISGEVTAPADPAAAQRKPSRTLLRAVAIVAALLVAGWVTFGVRHVSRRAAKEI